MKADENHVFSVDVNDINDGLKECTYTLTIPSGKHSNTGTYKIKAKNKYGEDESSVRMCA